MLGYAVEVIESGERHAPAIPAAVLASARLAARSGVALDAVLRRYSAGNTLCADVLLVVVTSRVLSTQYIVWLLGLAAVVLSAGTARLARPAWIVVGATALSTATFKSPELTLIRDAALLAATIDAALAMVAMLRRAEPGTARGS